MYIYIYIYIYINMWLLARMRQPRCHLFSELSRDMWADFLRALLTGDNLLFESEIQGIETLSRLEV